MDENPSSPEDGLEDALRRALSDAVGGVEPGTDGLDKIRARVDRRPPRPWLAAIVFRAAERARSWTWRGHWVWPGSLLGHAHPPWRRRRPRHRRGTSAGKQGGRDDIFPWPLPLHLRRIRWVWLAGTLAGVAILVGLSLNVQPFRHVIIQAGSTVFHGSDQEPGGADADGTGTPAATDGSGQAAGGRVQPAPTAGYGSVSGPSGVPGPVPPAACQQPASGAAGKSRPAPTASGTVSSSSGTKSSTDRRTPVPVASGTIVRSTRPTTSPDRPATLPSTCSVLPGTATATPTGSAQDSGTSSPPDSSAGETPTSTPAYTPTYPADPATTPADTFTGTDAPSDVTTSPTSGRSGSWWWHAWTLPWHDGRHLSRR